jgi:hypothetical protein
MAEQQKKPKIDLKARLGKKGVPGTPGGSVPPPMGIPKPGGIPAPPFGRKGPKVDASDPYSAIDASAAPARAEPRAIKVEMSEEVVQAQKKGKSKIMALAMVTALVGGILGFTLGGRIESNRGAKTAVAGAKDLVNEVDVANAKVEELATLIQNAKAKLGSNKFPDEEVTALGAINIPFEGSNLTGKGIGRFKPVIVKMLLDYAIGAQKANDQKERLQAVLGGAKSGVVDLLSQQTAPKVRWATLVMNGPGGPWATMVALPQPFAVKAADGKWPEKFKLKDGNKDVEYDRYTKGDPIGSEPDVIPVNPVSQGSVCPSDVLTRLRRELSDTEEVLRGSEVPGDEKQGLLDLGNKLKEQLKGIGSPS